MTADKHLISSLKRFTLDGWDLNCAFFDHSTGFARLVTLSELERKDGGSLPSGMRLISAVPLNSSRVDAAAQKLRVDSIQRGHLKQQHEFFRLGQAIMEDAANRGDIELNLTKGPSAEIFIADPVMGTQGMRIFEMTRKLDGD